jgi:hypothetical protein
MKKTILILAGLLFVITITFCLLPINTSKENSIEVRGIVKSISEGGAHDLVFELENDKVTYYINRGLENGYTLDKAKATFINKKATINYQNSWTILAPFGKTSENIQEIRIDDIIIFSERKS